MRVLVVEDDPHLGDVLRRGLRAEGAAVDLAATGTDAVWRAASTHYDAIVLDVMLPGMDGFETCRRFRAEEVWAPVLMLTARDEVSARVAGLDAGADDYLVKPFAFDELLARLRALVRRGASARPVLLEAAGLRLDPARHAVWRGDREIELSPKEIAMLELLMRRAGRVVSRFALLESGWDEDYDNRFNVVAVHIRNLRDKIDRPFGTQSIRTIRGVGYRLVP